MQITYALVYMQLLHTKCDRPQETNTGGCPEDGSLASGKSAA